MRAKVLLLPGLFGVACLFAGLALMSTASGQEPPPFPILYGGRVFLDGEPAPPGTNLVARVDDYEASTVVEEDGHYRNLLVAPPSRRYFEMPVAFHVRGVIARERDVFLTRDEPLFKATGGAAFDLHFEQEGGSGGLVVPLLLGAAAVAVVGVAGVLVVRRVRGRRG